MNIKDLHSLYLAELQEARSFEDQIASTLETLIKHADDPDLRRTLEEDLPEARRHALALGAMIEGHGAPVDEHSDQAMSALLAESRKWVGEIDDPVVRDAALIASAQRIQHYEIAVYGSLVAWAKQLGLDDRDQLQKILEEEKKTDAKLTGLAIRSVNSSAMA